MKRLAPAKAVFRPSGLSLQMCRLQRHYGHYEFYSFSFYKLLCVRSSFDAHHLESPDELSYEEIEKVVEEEDWGDEEHCGHPAADQHRHWKKIYIVDNCVILYVN